MIGDPTDKLATRKKLTKDEALANARDYKKQAGTVIDFDGENGAEFKYNSEWLSRMTYADILELESNFTHEQMIKRDMFQKRIEKKLPISVMELQYPLLQGYDSVVLKTDIELGATDQLFNMLVGRDLERKLLNKDKLVFATRLLVDAESGKKMSKTEGGLISLSDSPQDMFGKTMKTVPDEMTELVFRLCTEKPAGWIEGKKRSEPYDFKKELASELVRMYYGEKESMKAWQEWERVFSKGELPSEMEEVKMAKLVELVGLVTQGSSSSAKILIDQGAVKINGEVKKEWNFVPKEGDVVQIGPKKFVKVARE